MVSKSRWDVGGHENEGGQLDITSCTQLASFLGLRKEGIFLGWNSRRKEGRGWLSPDLLGITATLHCRHQTFALCINFILGDSSVGGMNQPVDVPLSQGRLRHCRPKHYGINHVIGDVYASTSAIFLRERQSKSWPKQ